MRVLEVTGARQVAALLRSLAEEIDRDAVSVSGRPVELSESLRAVVELDDSISGAVSTIDIRLVRTAEHAFELTRLEQALAHPGD